MGLKFLSLSACHGEKHEFNWSSSFLPVMCMHMGCGYMHVLWAWVCLCTCTHVYMHVYICGHTCAAVPMGAGASRACGCAVLLCDVAVLCLLFKCLHSEGSTAVSERRGSVCLPVTSTLWGLIGSAAHGLGGPLVHTHMPMMHLPPWAQLHMYAHKCTHAYTHVCTYTSIPMPTAHACIHTPYACT